MRKLACIGLLAVLLFSGLVIMPFISHDVSATSSCTWKQTSGNLASTAANWENGSAPTTGDDVYFTSLSTADCTWNLAISAGLFKIATGYSGTITQAASFSVTNYLQAAGILTGSLSYVLTDNGAFTKTGGTITSHLLKLTMAGHGNAITLNGITYLPVVIINDDTSTAGAGTLYGVSTTIASGKTFTINTEYVAYDRYGALAWSNSGTIAGSSDIQFHMREHVATTITFGTINIPVILVGDSDANFPNTIISAGAATVFGSTLTISGGTQTHTLTFDMTTSNYALTATAITIGTRGILNARGSTITCSGSWDSSAGTFTQGTSSVRLTGTSKTLKTDGVSKFNNLFLDVGASYTLSSNVKTTNYWKNGTLTTNGYTLYINNDQAPAFVNYDSSKWVDWFSAYSYTFTATDREAETLTFSLTSTLSGLTIGSSSGIASKSAFIANGTWTVTVSVSDGNHTTTGSTYVLDVRYTPASDLARIITALANLNTNLTTQANRLNTAMSNLATNLTTQANRINTAVVNLATNLTTQADRLNTATANLVANLTSQANRLNTAILNQYNNLSTENNRLYSEVSNLNNNLTTVSNTLTTENVNLAANLTAQADRLTIEITNQMTNITSLCNSSATLLTATWIGSSPKLTAHVNETYSYQPIASYLKYAKLTWTLHTNATGLNISSTTGKITGIINKTGVYYVNLTAVASGITTWQNYTLSAVSGALTDTEIFTIILALFFGFALLMVGLKRHEFWLLAGPVWIVCGLTIFIGYGVVFLLTSVGLGMVLFIMGAYDALT